MAPLPRSRPVVVGIDDSDGSRAALAFATEEARQRNAPLRLLHALSWPLGGTAAVVSTDARLRTVLEAGAQTLLRTAAGEAADVLGSDRVSWSVVDGDPVTALRTAELLVVGHRSRRPLARLGSTTHGVLHRAGCPVAVVPVATDAHRGG